MVACQYNCRIGVKILLLNPADKPNRFSGRIRDNVCILVAVFILYTRASVTIREVGISRFHIQMEGLARF